jgi:preprotein translocase subunit YajC
MSISNLFISNAYAEGAPAAASGSFMDFIPLIGLVAVFVFFVILPQMKRTKEVKAMLAALQKGDEVVTTGGVMGRITKVGDSYISLEVAEGVNLNIQKGAIQTALPKGTIKSVN